MFRQLTAVFISGYEYSMWVYNSYVGIMGTVFVTTDEDSS